MQCPKCFSESVQTERRPNGKSTCMSCSYISKTVNFYSKEELIPLPEVEDLKERIKRLEEKIKMLERKG